MSVFNVLTCKVPPDLTFCLRSVFVLHVLGSCELVKDDTYPPAANTVTCIFKI